jgi:hypothetical protein
VHIVDGQQTIVGLGEHHWAMARALLDAVRPERDAMVSQYAPPAPGCKTASSTTTRT